MKQIHIFGAKSPRAHPRDINIHVAGPLTMEEANKVCQDPKSYKEFETLQRCVVRPIGRRSLGPKDTEAPPPKPIDALAQAKAIKDPVQRKAALEALEAKEAAKAKADAKPKPAAKKAEPVNA